MKSGNEVAASQHLQLLLRWLLCTHVLCSCNSEREGGAPNFEMLCYESYSIYGGVVI